MTRGASASIAILRVVVGFTILMHGWWKLTPGHDYLTRFLVRRAFPLPGLTAWGAGIVEVLGGLLLVAGLLVVPVAILFGLELLAEIVLFRAPYGWFVGPERGMELHVVLIAALLVLIFAGPGAAALGRRRGDRT